MTARRRRRTGTTLVIVFCGLPMLSILHQYHMAPAPARVVERVMLHHRDDSRHDDSPRESREITLYAYGGSLFTVWEAVRFISGSDATTQYQLRIGSKSEMQLFLKSEVERLCDEEGFKIVMVSQNFKA